MTVEGITCASMHPRIAEGWEGEGCVCRGRAALTADPVAFSPPMGPFFYTDSTAQNCVCCPASFLSPEKELGTEENDYSVPICTINTAPPLNSSPYNPAVFDFNELLQHLRSLLKATVQIDSSLGVWKCLTGRYRMPGDFAEYLSFFFTIEV